jgi:hypothetical protein
MEGISCRDIMVGGNNEFLTTRINNIFRHCGFDGTVGREGGGE